MSLNYIFGGCGTGKTQYCLKEIISFCKQNNNKTLICIVPEQFTLETEKNLCMLSDNNAIIFPQVLSFQRLAYNIFSKTGGITGKLLDESGKNMLLRKIVFELRSQLVFYGKSVDKQGFIENLSQIIREFYQYNFELRDFKRYIDTIKDKESLYLKMTDLYKIYNKYVTYIQNKYILTDTALDFVPSKIDDSKFLADSYIWIDGFTGFTPQEYKIIEKILTKCSDVTIALTLKSKESHYQNIKEIDPFFEIKNTVNKLTKLAEQNNVKISKPILLDKNYRFKNFPEMAFLEKNFLHLNKNEYYQGAKNISILSASNIYTEVTETAISILNLARESNYRYSEIAIVCPVISDYEKPLKSIFSIYDIPFFIDSKTDILSHPLVELIRSAIDIVAYNWNYESVFRFLKTNMTNVCVEDIDILENYVLAYGIKGTKWQLESWQYGSENSFFDIEQINIIKKNVLCCLEPFCNNIIKTKKLSVREFSERIFALLKYLNVNETLDNWILQMTEQGNHIVANQHSQIYNKVCTVFDKIVEILGEEKINCKQFGKVLEAGFTATDLGFIPPAQDQVLIGDIERSRFPKIKALFILGVNEGILPSTKKELGLLSDDERLFLTSTGVELAPDSKRKSYASDFLIYSTITKPENKLFLSYCMGNLNGKSMQPSNLISKIKKMFPNLIETAGNEKEAITLPKPMFYKMGEVLRNYYLTGDEPSLINKDIYNWFNNIDYYAQKLRVMEKILFKKNKDEFLSQHSVKKLYGKEIITGISRLEKYIKCPFAYFVQYNLDAKERKIYEFKPTDYGNLFHNILEEFSKKISDEKIDWEALDKKKIDTFVEGCINNLAPNMGDEILLSTAKYKYIIKRISRISKKSIWALSEHIKSGDFKPFGAEISFGKGQPFTSISFNINKKQKLILTGRIDRIDILDFDGNKYVKIIDYKSGAKKFDLSDLYFGMQLQLLMYLDAFIKNAVYFFGEDNIHGEVLPGGIFYFNIDDPILEYNDEIIPEKLEEMILKTFKMTGLVLKDENVVKGIDNNINGWSKIIPVQLTGNGFSSKSSVATIEDFDVLRDHIIGKVIEIGNEIVKGNINISPYNKLGSNQSVACKYCGYKAICHIDVVEDKNKFNIVKKINNVEHIIEEIVNKGEQKTNKD